MPSYWMAGGQYIKIKDDCSTIFFILFSLYAVTFISHKWLKIKVHYCVRFRCTSDPDIGQHRNCKLELVKYIHFKYIKYRCGDRVRFLLACKSCTNVKQELGRE